MSKTNPPFPYPGGKSRYADWIIDNFAAHTCYVELFGGAAAVLLRKSESDVEVYNDVNGHLSAFFTVVRDHPDDLLDWVRDTPPTRDLHTEYRQRLYGDADVPDDPVERAGMLYYLQRLSFGSKPDDAYATPVRDDDGKYRNYADSYGNSFENLRQITRRFQGVTVENRDWRDVVDRFDHPDALIYADPPYPDTSIDYDAPIDEAALFDRVAESDANWAISYPTVPDHDAIVDVRQKEGTFTVGGDTNHHDATEYLLLTYDPEDTPLFVDSGRQDALDAFS